MATVANVTRHLGSTVAAVFLVLLMPGIARAQICGREWVEGDEDIWSDDSSMAELWYRDMFIDHYGLGEGDWDEVWGWEEYGDPNAHRYPFPKMMSSGRLLWNGIDDSPGTAALLSQGKWSAREVWVGADDDVEPPIIRVVSRAAEEVDLLYVDSSGELVHLLFSGDPWYAGEGPDGSSQTSVSDVVATPKNNYRVVGPPEVVSASPDNLEIVARQDNALLHFRWSQSGGWTVQDPTTLTARPAPVNGSDRYFIHSKPVVLRGDSDESDVFAVDNFKHLIHYGWVGGAWYAEDITHKLPDNPRIMSDPVVSRRSYGTIDIFGRSSSGRLLHYRRDDETGWSCEEVTAALRDLPTNYRLEGNPAVVSPDGQSLIVFYTIDYNLYALSWTEPFGWTRLQIARDFLIQSDPVVVKRKRNEVHGFARDLMGHLIHFFFRSQLGFGAERVSADQVVDVPTVLVTNEDRLDVFLADPRGWLLHYYWADPGGWRVENIHLTAGVQSNYSTVGSPRAAVRRGDSSLEVFAASSWLPPLAWHFTSALGPAVSSWHTNREYSEWASGALHGFTYAPEFDESEENPAAAQGGFWQEDIVKMRCQSFVVTPAHRASFMLHEATHIIFWPWDHSPNPNLPPDECEEPCSDIWLPHGARAEAGRLGVSRNHSPYQITIEYLTDISEFPSSWVPPSAYRNALEDAKTLMRDRILNPPPNWSPGTPRPLR